LSFQFNTLEDKRNIILNRRELRLALKNAAGKISKIELIKMLSKNFNVDEKKIFPISMEGEKGKTDIKATIFIYEDPELAKSHLPKYRILRKLSGEDRKKIIDEEKAAKLKAKQAAKAESK
jgi:small subunit ribosomal protein S24e